MNRSDASLRVQATMATQAIQGVLMILGNGVLVLVILLTGKLRRRREMLLIGGLALADGVYGVGNALAGVARLRLVLDGRLRETRTQWECFQLPQTPFFIVGAQSAGLMMVAVSLDRLLAVQYYLFYLKLSRRYAVWIVLVVFGYCVTSVPVVGWLSRGSAPRNVTALCLAIQVASVAYEPWQPTVQMSCGVASVALFAATLGAYRRHLRKSRAWHWHKKGGWAMARQRRLTRLVGISVLVTLVTYVVPGAVQFSFTRLVLPPESRGPLNALFRTFGNFNSMVNVGIFGLGHPDVRKALALLWRNLCGAEAKGPAVAYLNAPKSLPVKVWRQGQLLKTTAL